MHKFVIEGGRSLRGAVRVSGAKNAILPMLAATVLVSEECVLHDVPLLRDTHVMMDILSRLGVNIEQRDSPGMRGTLKVHAGNLITCEVQENLTREMRSSIFLMGPLLGRLGRVRVAYPGGCLLGPRPIDLHLRGLEALGAEIREKAGYIDAETRGLKGAEIHLDFPSVGATENIMMAAVLASGTTSIRNAAKEPEIVDLQNFLNSMGARIKGAGTDIVRIEGVSSLHGTHHTVIPDRIEAGTFLVAAAITRGELELENVIPEHMDAVIAKLREAGATIEEGRDRIWIKGPVQIKATDFKTLPYPGFPTDMQPQMMALMTVANGTSVITETIFESRFKQAEELRRMGANIKMDGRTAIVKGVRALSGAAVEAPSLREGASLVLAGLAAEGTTTVEGVQHIDRGYEYLEEKLRSVGARIRRL